MATAPPATAPAASAPSAATVTQQDIITSIQALITTAKAESTLPGATQAAQLAALQLIALLQATLLQIGMQTPPAPALYIVSPADLATGGLFGIAFRTLGDPLRWSDIGALNGLRFLALQPGQQLLLPSS